MLPPMLSEPALDRRRTCQRRLGPVERDEETIAGVLDLLCPMLCEQGAQRAVVPADEILPGLVADRLDEIGRLDDVREDERPHRPTGLRRPGAPEQCSGAGELTGRAEPLEQALGRLELELRGGGVSVALVRFGEQDPRPCSLVGSVDLLPEVSR